MNDYSILLVEDNPDDQLLTLRALKSASSSSNVILREDGQQALDFLFGTDTQERDSAVDSLGMILLDLKLPRVNGIEVLKQIRASASTDWLPVIMISSSDEPEELREAYRLGVNSYITKPIDYSEFSEQMKLLARYWLKVNQVPKLAGVHKL